VADATIVKDAETAAPAPVSNKAMRNAIHTLTDSEGRKLVVKRPSVLQQFRLVELLGPELGKNTMYLNMAMPAFWVQSIDGEPLYAPATKLELEAAVERLDEHGLDAVNDHILSQPETITKAGLKNASGTQASDKPSL